MFSKNKTYNKKRNGGSKNQFKGKKFGKEYFEYVEECKRKQELLIKQRLEECKSNDVSGSIHENSISEQNNGIKNAEDIHGGSQVTDLKVEEKYAAMYVKCDGTSVNIKSDNSFKIESNVKEERIQKADAGENEGLGVKNEACLSLEHTKSQFKEFKSKEDADKLIVPEDPKVLIAIETLVSQISMLPKHLQEVVMKQSEDQEDYWFLTLTGSVEYTYFHWRLKQSEEAKRRNEESLKINNEAVFTSDGKKKRKTRWSTGPMQTVMISVLNQSSQVLTDTQKMQMNYQKELQAMQEFIHAQHRAKKQEVMHKVQVVKCGKRIVKSGTFKYDYDSDEDTSGGTWEHKLRESEMEATRVMADKLTEMGQGRHHIGDFLPPEELVQFMETFQALKEGREPEFSDFNNFKITCENVGFKMLQKMGWKEGEGLGNDGKGILTPIESAPLKSDTLGVGVCKTAMLSKYDDEYDAYRKRMMLAYRFRPNPLNNPRRDYY